MTALVSPAQQAVKEETEEERLARLKSASQTSPSPNRSIFQVVGLTAYGRKWAKIERTENFEKFGDLGALFKEIGTFFFGNSLNSLGRYSISSQLDLVLVKNSNQVVSIWLGRQGAKESEPAANRATWPINLEFTKEQIIRALGKMEIKGDGETTSSKKNLKFKITAVPPPIDSVTPKIAHDYMTGNFLSLAFGVQLSRWDACDFPTFIQSAGIKALEEYSKSNGPMLTIGEKLSADKDGGERKKYFISHEQYISLSVNANSKAFFKSVHREICDLNKQAAGA